MAELLARLREYGRRFTPLLIGHVVRNIKEIPKTIDVDPRVIGEEIQETLTRLDDALPFLSFHRPPSERDREVIRELLLETLGFTLERRKSTVAGDGIFVSLGTIRSGHVASLYPGLIYQPGDPLLLPSIANSFVLRCGDGQTVDGNDRRLSRWMFRSCAFRECFPVCDLSWMDHPLNFLNQGQYVNDSREIDGNVQYVDVDVIGWPIRLRRWLPYAHYRANPSDAMRIVALVATKDIEKDEELLSDYVSIS